MLGVAAFTAQPEFLLPAALFAGGAMVVRGREQRRQLGNMLINMQHRLNVAERELETTTTEISQLNTEREFDRQLLRRP